MCVCNVQIEHGQIYTVFQPAIYSTCICYKGALSAREVVGKFILMTLRPPGEDIQDIYMPLAVQLIHVGLAQARPN